MRAAGLARSCLIRPTRASVASMDIAPVFGRWEPLLSVRVKEKRATHGRPLHTSLDENEFYCRSFKTACGCALAWARTDTPACSKTCSLVKLVISAAMFTSTMPLYAEERFWL